MPKFSRTVDYYGTTYKVNKSGNIDCGKTMLPENEYEMTATAPHHRVHRIIAKAFPEICGVWFEGCHVHHINGNKTDNRAENLAILTPSAHNAIHEYEWKKKDEVLDYIYSNLEILETDFPQQTFIKFLLSKLFISKNGIINYEKTIKDFHNESGLNYEEIDFIEKVSHNGFASMLVWFREKENGIWFSPYLTIIFTEKLSDKKKRHYFNIFKKDYEKTIKLVSDEIQRQRKLIDSIFDTISKK